MEVVEISRKLDKMNHIISDEKKFKIYGISIAQKHIYQL